MFFPLTLINSLLFIVIIPTLTGLYLSRFFKLTQNFYVWYPLGNIFLWACSQLILVPLILIKASFYLALFLIVFLYIAGASASLLLCLDNWKAFRKPRDLFSRCWKSMSKSRRMSILVTVIVTGIVVILVTFFQKQEYSDVHYIVSAVDMQKSGRMFLSNPASGALQSFFSRNYLSDLTSPWAFQYAFLGTVTFSRPIVAAHIMIPFQIILLCTCIYRLLARKFSMGRHRIENMIFILMLLLQILGCYSRYCTETMMLTRAWKSDAVIGSVLIPFIIWLYLCIERNPRKKNFYKVLLMADLSLCYLGSTGIFLGIFLNLGFGIYYSIQKKNKAIIMASLFCLIPNLLYSIIKTMTTGFDMFQNFGDPRIMSRLINAAHLYAGNKLMIILGVLSALYLSVSSKPVCQRLVYPVLLSLALSLVFMLTSLLPANMVTAEIYWLFPEALLITIAFLRILHDTKSLDNLFFAYGVMAILVVTVSSPFFTVNDIHPTENIQKIDNQCKTIYDYILSQDLTPSCILCDEYIWAARQYSGSFILPYIYNEDGSLTFAHAHDQSLPYSMTRIFPVSYFICLHGSLNKINYIVVKAKDHLQIRYLMRHNYYVDARIDDTIIYSRRTPGEVAFQKHLSRQLHLGRSGFYKALRRMDSKRLSLYKKMNQD